MNLSKTFYLLLLKIDEFMKKKIFRLYLQATRNFAHIYIVYKYTSIVIYY